MLRDEFVGKVLFEFLQVKPEDLFCLQWNAAEQGFDVSLISSGVFERLKLECQGKADEEPLSAFKVFSLERKNLKIVTVHMFNPYVGDKTVIFFGEIWTGAVQRQILEGRIWHLDGKVAVPVPAEGGREGV